MSEVQTKLERIRTLLDAYQLDALWLRLASSFAWATGGKSSYINTASSNGLASLLITRDRRYVITNNIEKPRIGGKRAWRQRAGSLSHRSGIPPKTHSPNSWQGKRWEWTAARPACWI